MYDSFSSMTDWINVEANYNRTVEINMVKKFDYVWETMQKLINKQEAEIKGCEEKLNPLTLQFKHFSED